MSLLEQLHHTFFAFLKQKYQLSKKTVTTITFELNTDESKQQFGDITCNAALVLAKTLSSTPRDIAQSLAQEFANEHLQKIEVAGPGFLNFFLKNESYIAFSCSLFEHKDKFFKPTKPQTNRYSVEFVSANPTGPLHLGHGRGGIIGDVLGNILRFLGNKVTKEFYINDAGSQIEKLGTSFKIRCEQELGVNVLLPEGGYHGNYLVALAQVAVKQFGKALLEKPASFFAEYTKEHMLAHIKKTLELYGITFDVWFSEKQLHANGAIGDALELLEKKGLTYKQDGALWFKSTQFSDDKNRVLRKQNGELTYISADIAYTENKFARTDHAIMILGQDHHSYVVRLKGITQALGLEPDNLDVILYQLVTLKESGQQLRMSKRAGTMVTLREIIQAVGKDVARFFFLNRKADAHLDFDLDLALKKTEENPVYYIQYAYVRTKSILEKALQKDEFGTITPDDAICIGTAEHLLLKKIIALKLLLTDIARNHQTHLLTYYVLELAQLFHSYYAKNKVADMDNIPQSRARLLLVKLLKNTFELCLKLLGLERPEKM